MRISNFFRKQETLVSVDIGATSVKMVEINWSGAVPKLTKFSSLPIAPDTFAGNQISKPEDLSNLLLQLVESAGNTDRRFATSVPSPSVFTKRIKVPRIALAELDSNIRLEAANFIPHNIDAVHLDFHVVAEVGKNQLEVLVIAVKNEVVESFLESFGFAGFDVAVVDIDYFALQNAFEALIPELIPKTVALINMGHRFSSINICQGGESLFTGDISVAGKVFTDALVEGLGVSVGEAERIKAVFWSEKKCEAAAQEILERQAEILAGEINRQLSFYWSASGSEQGIDQILLTGGGSQISGLAEQLSDKTGVVCRGFDAVQYLEVDAEIDQEKLAATSNQLTIAIGMSLRQPGDRIVPEYLA